MTTEQPASNRLFARNTLVLFFAQLASRGLGFFSAILLANYLGVEKFGLYNFALAFPLLFIPLYDLGIDTFITREIASSADIQRRLEDVALGAKILLSLLASVVLLAGTFLLPYSPLQRPYAGMGILIVILRTFPATQFDIFRGYQRMGLEARSSVVGKSLEFLALVAAVLIKVDLAWIFVLLLATSLFQIGYTQNLASSVGVASSVSFRGRELRGLLRGGVPFFLTAVSVQITQQMSTVILGFVLGEQDVGLYRSAQALVLGFSFVVAAFAGALLPAVSAMEANDRRGAQQLASRSLSSLLAIGLPLALTTTLLSGEIISLLYSPSYAPAAPTLAIVIWWLPLMYCNTVLGTILGGIQRQKLFMMTTLTGAMLNIVLCFALIPWFGHRGAALATVATEVIELGLLIWFVHREFGPVFHWPSVVRVALACLLILPVPFLGSHVLISLALAVSVYVVGLAVSGFLSRQEIRTLRAFLSGRAGV